MKCFHCQDKYAEFLFYNIMYMFLETIFALLSFPSCALITVALNESLSTVFVCSEKW